MKRHAWIAVLSGLLLNVSAVGQTVSHFDLSGNMSFNGAKFATAPGATGNGQVNGFGWQTSGISHFNRWLSFTSQFGSSYASSDAIQLIGFTGPGTMRHYSMLAGPRVSLPSFGRISPFVQGLAGIDRASTSLTSGSTAVTGREYQLAYAFGGGAQVGINRRFGLNFEAQYFGSEHSLAFTGWEPAHFQLSAGIVIRMFGVRDRRPIAEERPLPPPTPAQSAPAIVANSKVEPAAPETNAFLQPSVASPAQPQMPSPAPPVVNTAPVIQTPVQPVVVAKANVAPAIAPAPAPIVTATHQQPVATAGPMPAGSPVASAARTQAQSQPPAPMSLGEYARRLREKKQQQQ